jgi:hypothetical protein
MTEQENDIQLIKFADTFRNAIYTDGCNKWQAMERAIAATPDLFPNGIEPLAENEWVSWNGALHGQGDLVIIKMKRTEILVEINDTNSVSVSFA